MKNTETQAEQTVHLNSLVGCGILASFSAVSDPEYEPLNFEKEGVVVATVMVDKRFFSPNA